LKWLVDVDFYIRLLSANRDFVFTRVPLVSIELSDESMTAACLGTRSVELFEYLYLYRKLSAMSKLSLRYDLVVWRICALYGIRGYEDLADLGVDLSGLRAIRNGAWLLKYLQRAGILTKIEQIVRRRGRMKRRIGDFGEVSRSGG
jgi:hypothetical protein